MWVGDLRLAAVRFGTHLLHQLSTADDGNWTVLASLQNARYDEF